MSEKKNKNRISSIIIALIFVLGLGVLLYPTLSDIWNRYRNQQLISEYTAHVATIAKEDYSAIFAAAEEFNKLHTRNQIVDAFDEHNEYELTAPYNTMLNPTGDNIMGYIVIPKINVRLAVLHGVGEESLQRAAGHVEGTSLPVGGENTHAVISAHRGLPSAKLFTDLDQIVIGDLFYMHVLDQVFAYKVDQIKTVLPTEVDSLEIEKNKDQMTLLTCTPYGVNTHRLLVRGERVSYEERTEEEIKQERIIEEEADNHNLEYLILGVIVFAILFVVIVTVYILSGGKTKRRGDKDEGSNKKNCI